MSGHTAGPWEAVDRLTVRSRYVAGADDGHGWLVASLPPDAAAADARLIAAAPMLLEALRELLSEAEEGISTCPLTRAAARAAIAAATGEA